AAWRSTRPVGRTRAELSLTRSLCATTARRIAAWTSSACLFRRRTSDAQGRSRAAISSSPDGRERHQLALPLVPQRKADAPEAFPQRQRRDLAQLGMLVQRLLEPIVGDAGMQVVDVVEPDVPRGPLEQPGETVVGAPLQRRGVVRPALVVLPVRRLELVLDVEQPYAE